ncbi:hypothetical protein Tco_1152147 [Tanacetum coccineum]
MSTSSTTSRRRLPTNYKSGLPLVKRMSWTYLNPARRNLNCCNSNHLEERFQFVEYLRAQDQLERLQIEHDGLDSKFEQSRKSYRFMKIMIACIVVVFMVMKM